MERECVWGEGNESEGVTHVGGGGRRGGSE